MSKTRMVLLRIAGSAFGLLVVGGAVGVALFPILTAMDPDKGGSFEGLFPAIFSVVGGVVVGTVGAAAGATVTQRRMKQRSSFWKALLGAFIGMVIGLPFAWMGFLFAFIPVLFALATVVAGAVIGSGWKAGPRDAASPLR